MMDFIRKYRSILLYLVFGVLTTLVNWAAYWVFVDTYGMPYLWATVSSQVLAVLFAYVTNRRWVFDSRAYGWRDVSFEMARFFGCRAASFFLDVGLMYVGVDVFCLNDKVMKLVSNFVIVIVNYAFSKVFVFKKMK